MKRMIWITCLLTLTMGCSDEQDVASRVLKANDLATARTLAKTDPAEGKRIASWCAGCHGPDGISVDKTLPHLAGQQPFYLYTQLQAYGNGGRDNDAMKSVVKSLGEGSMIKLAAFYASQTPTELSQISVGHGDGTGGTPVKEPMLAGASTADECAGCHGEDGNSAMEGVPSLAGHHPADLVAAMHAYKTAGRDDPVMQSVLAEFNEADIANVALYYAAQNPKRTDANGKGDPDAGRRIAAVCAACHGEDGNSPDPNTPSLAGEDAEYLASATRAYVNGKRDYLMMTYPVAALSEQDIENLSAFYASQKPKAAKLDRPLTTEDWVAKCDRCHGKDGNSADPRFPSLSAQRKEYIASALKAYQAEIRKSSMMRAMTALLGKGEIENIAAYYETKRRQLAAVTEESRQ